MRKAVMPFVLSVGLMAVWAAPAGAASTRAEYALQADPICRSADQDTTRLWKRFLRLNKRSKSKGATNALRSIKARTKSSNRELRLIAPPPGDEALIGEWLGIWDQIATRWGFAALGYKLKLWSELDNQLHQISQRVREARRVVSGFPFQACA
jgi:hypothetical protein